MQIVINVVIHSSVVFVLELSYLSKNKCQLRRIHIDSPLTQYFFQDYFEYEYPLYPDITLKKNLDFEQTTYMEIEIMAKVCTIIHMNL